MILNLSAAYILDLIFGDPQWFPHPVRGIGFLIERGEKIFRKTIPSEIFSGACLSVLLIFSVYFATDFLLKSFPYPFSFGIEIFLLYACLSTKDLAVESRRVETALRGGDWALARGKCAWIVGRDTENLSEKEVARATVETVAENTVDGVIAPLFFAVLGGAPLACAYKTVNTLDSMIGHKDERYIHFGKFAAWVDRAANWMPARVSGVIIPLAGRLLKYSFRNSWKGAWRDGNRSNATIPEGAMAGALGVQLGGENYYKGERRMTPLLGIPNKFLTPDKISESIRVMYVASGLALLLAIFARILMEKFL